MSSETPRKRKILFLSHAGNLYGACRSLYDILEGIDKRAFEPHLASPTDGLLLEQARALGIPTVLAPSKTWASAKTLVLNTPLNLYGAAKLAAYIRKHKIDLVYTNSGGVISGALAAAITRTPHVWHVREEVSSHESAFRAMHRLSRRLVANSEFTKKRFPNELRANISVIYNGFHLKDYAVAPNEKEEIKKRYGFQPHDTVVSLVGNINERKGQKETLEALPAILAKHPRVKIVFAGEVYAFNKDYQEALDAIIARENLKDKVVFTGFKKDVSEIYKMSDLLLVPSRYEAFGRVVVEGMLFGVPVLGTNTGGIPEIIEHGKTGILIEGRKPEVLGGAIIAALDDRPALGALASAGKASAEQKFRIETTVRNVEHLLWLVLAA